jgi:hypothetical protein
MHLSSPTHDICPARLIFLDLITLTIFGRNTAHKAPRYVVFSTAVVFPRPSLGQTSSSPDSRTPTSYENCALLVYYAASIGNFLLTFRDRSVPHCSLRDNPEECSSQLLRGGSLKSHPSTHVSPSVWEPKFHTPQSHKAKRVKSPGTPNISKTLVSFFMGGGLSL